MLMQNNFQKILYWAYVLLLLVPNFIIFAISSKSFYVNLPNILIPTSLYMMFMLLSRRPGKMFLYAFPFIFLGAFQLVLIMLSKSSVIGADMFTNIFTTNSSEAGDVLRTLTSTLITFVVVYGTAYTLSYFSIKSGLRLSDNFVKRVRIASIAIFVCGGASLPFAYASSGYYSVVQDIFPINVVNNLGVSIHRWGMSKSYPQTSKDFKFNAHKETKQEREVYVLVVGESSRADRWQLYGYGRNTTPRLIELGDELIKMTDAVTQSNTTHKSTALIMSSCSAENFEKVYTQKSVVTAFDEAGFTTLFISNQIANGSFMDFYASEADKRIDLPSRIDGENHYINYDGAALPYIRNFIDSTTENLFIVVHTYGSHLQYHDRYPKDFEKFSPASSKSATNAKEIEATNNAYDNSILYTDYFLAEVIDILRCSGLKAGFMYISDHGEDLYDDSRNRFLHSSPSLTYYQLHIPYLMWFSDSYKSSYPQNYSAAVANSGVSVSSGSVFHTMLNMADIETTYLDPTQSIVSSNYSERDRLFLNDSYKPVYFAATELTDIDFKLLKDKKIRYKENLVK